ncbi:hypothetical protein [Polaribacter sp.]|uniref:hypothetical protein n=1 Tax=Polaribacter sp. TaxID=1920175 RepID=UPI003EF5A203
MIRKILVVFLLIASATISAQRTSSSPYSFFGIGDKFNQTTIEQSSMGGIGVAFSHYKYLNFTNPAAYSDLKYTTYGFGVLSSNLSIKNGDITQNSNSTTLSYVSLAFPIGKKAGMAFGLQPLSSVGYSLSNTVYDTSNTPIEISLFSGSGGINKLYASFGIKILKELSLGIEGTYSFGNIENSILNQRADVTLATKYKDVSNVRGNSLKIGSQYKKELKNKLIVNAGAAITLGNVFKVTGDDYLYSLTLSSAGSEIPRDTISTNSMIGNYNIPLKSVFGAGVGKFDKWYFGVEYETQDAINTSGFTQASNIAYNYENSSRISAGGFYLPKINSISNYWHRVTYRAGVRFEKTGLLVDGSGNNTNFTPIDDFGISFGLGLPLKRLSTINLGFEYGKRGTNTNNLIQENYFNFRLSLSLTDTGWFQKRKID